MREFSNLNFNHYVNLFTDSNDELSLQELYLLRERCPDFDFSKYKVGIFTLENIEKFGQDFLLKNYEWLNRSLLEVDADKIYYIEKNRKFIMFDPFAVANLSIEELDKINEINDDDIFYLFSELSKLNDFKKILPILFERIEVISFIAKNFEDVYSDYLRKDVKKFILSDNSLKCISMIDSAYITSETSLSKFLKSYFLCQDVIEFVDSDNKVKFNDLLFNNAMLNITIDSKFKLDDYYELKYQKVINLINNDIEYGKEIISELYFNIDYEILKKALITARKCNCFENYTKLLDINTKDDLIKFVSNIKCESNIYYSIETVLLLASKKSICDSIRPNFTPHNGIVVLDGCDFSFLVHSIKGYADYNKASRLSLDPSFWYGDKREDSYISTSYVSNDFIGMNRSISYILGFNSIVEDDILYSGLGDIYASKKQVRNNLRNGKSSCLLADDLRLNSKMIYNEVTLKRIRNGVILSPDFILSLDNIKKADEEAAKFFKVPIYLLDRMKYASRMQEKLYNDLLHDDLDAYLADLRRMFFSFCHSYEIFVKYFSPEKLEYNTLTLIRKYADSKDPNILKKVEDIINLYDSLILSYNFYMDGAIDYDKKRYVKMLKN